MGFPQSPASVPVSGASVGPSYPLGSLPRATSGLLFDMGDVLYDATLWRRWLLRVLSRLGLHTNYRSFYHVWDHDFLDDVHRGRREFSEAFGAFLLSVGLSAGQIDEVEAACQARRDQWEQTARLLPGVKTTLAKLHASGVVMGVLSDSQHPAGVLVERLCRLGVGDFFKAVVSSIDLERIKPDSICYRTVLEAMGRPAEQVAFVGHDTEELAGAAKAGLSTIAFNYDPDAKADVFLARFEELLQLVGPASPQPGSG
ncbi:MAG: HAD family hydrolase [Planctomycetota bacterium]